MPRILAAHETPKSSPDIRVAWWPDAPWREPASAQVDRFRTAGLSALVTGNATADRVRLSPSMPLQALGSKMTTVLTSPGFKRHRVPLPSAVWILRNNDDQWFGVDGHDYWEVSSLRRTVGWWAHGVTQRSFDTPWQSVLRGMAGGGIPIWAMVPTVGQLAAGAGGYEGCLNFVVAGTYAKDHVPWLTKTDGTVTVHPLRAGERLTLTPEAFDRLSAEHQRPEDQCVLWALRWFGALVNDKTSATAGHNIRLPYGADIRVKLTITDFQVTAST